MRTFAQLLESFLVEYAPRRRCLSDNTLRSYRDTFVLLLRWLSEELVEDIGRYKLFHLFRCSYAVTSFAWLQHTQKSTLSQRCEFAHRKFDFFIK